jgi:hypothetical protein
MKMKIFSLVNIKKEELKIRMKENQRIDPELMPLQLAT